MANEEVLGPRKTMFVLVIVVGCFAVLWPRILSPLILGPSKDPLKPNQFDRDAGCCEVLFDSEIAVLEVLNAVCNSVVHVSGKLSPYAAAECRKTVNDTCGVDIAGFLKRDENVGKTTKKLLETMKSSNSSCLKEHFGVTLLSLSKHPALNSWTLPDLVKQERPPMRGGPGPHPALRERGRAIPPGAPTPPSRAAVPMPAHMRPPPIPGMRPPLGSPGGPVAAPKSSMGLLMPIYTICIIVFFVYTLSKFIFKRTSYPYEEVAPDPHFRRRVFKDNSRTSPDKLGPKERDTRDEELEALRTRLAETERAMQRIVGQLAARDAEAQQDSQARSYTNGTVLHNSGPVHIVASEYQEQTREKSPKESSPEPKEPSVEPKQPSVEPKQPSVEPKESSPELKESSLEPKESSPEPIASVPELETKQESKEILQDSKENSSESLHESKETTLETEKSPDKETLEPNHVDRNDILKLSESDGKVEDSAKISTEDFINEARLEFNKVADVGNRTSELLEEALREGSPEEQENASVKVMGMETRAHAADGGAWPLPHAQTQHTHTARPAHEADQVSSIFLQTEIPQQSRVLVADFAQDREKQPAPVDSPLVVSGKMTLSLIQDEPRDTPERELESTMDDFTTASAMTQAAAEKQEELSDDDEEIEVEEEEVEEKEENEEDIDEMEVEEIEVEVTDSEEELENAKKTNKQ